MPESNEDITAPGDKLPPRRRRRAASRPAGPPVTGEAAEITGTTEAPAADTPEPAAAPAPVEAETEAPAPRTRRRATRKATAPA
ncbi:hypothetical protein ABGT92_21010, partial [Streptomyces cinereoruber]